MSKYIIQFNEANFDLIEKYAKEYDLSGFKKIIKMPIYNETSSEKEYQNLEPWIQWYSFYTGLNFDEHKVFHLGDCIKNNHETFIDRIIKNNKKVGIFGSMNHKYNENATIFIPDPWTQAKSDTSMSSRLVSKAMSRIINNNARMQITYKDLIGILFLILRPFRPLRLIKALISFIKKSRDELAAHFDIFFLNYSFSRSRKSKLDLTMIFLNGLAHTQHHYLLSSKFVDGNNPDWYSSNNKDPILECLKIYDQGFTELLKNLNDEDEIWILTGLSQEPFDEPINYWRFRDHNSILSEFINYDFKCNPRMTRDFELLFNNEKDAYRATEILNNIYVQAEEASYKAFIEIQNNDKSVFATFSYFGSCDCPILIYKNKKLNLKNAIDFIAVKNGGHSQKGWMISNSSINLSPNVVVPITNASSMMGL